MKNFLHRLRGAVVSLALFVAFSLALGALVLAPFDLAFAQTTTRTDINAPRVPPRLLNEQQTHYIRTTIAFNMCVQTSNACAVKSLAGSLPYNAVVLRVSVAVYTAFNSTTSDTIKVGITKASANEIVSTGVNLQSAGLASATVVAASINSIGNTAAQTGDDGGFNIWLLWTAGTGNTATAGLASVIIEYAAPNDATCTQVPLGGTAGGC